MKVAPRFTVESCHRNIRGGFIVTYRSAGRREVSPAAVEFKPGERFALERGEAVRT